MYYYHVAPTERSYLGREPLTYSSVERLKIGQCVVVRIRTSMTNGIILKQTSQPQFKTKIIDYVYKNVVLPSHQISSLRWLTTYYPSGLGSVATLFLPNLNQKSYEKHQAVVADDTLINLPNVPLSTQQLQTLNKIVTSKKTTQIIHGDTGTGKTLLYIHLAAKSIEAGKSVIILTPEISLTPQITEQLNKVFSNVTLLHSGMTTVQKREAWLKVYFCDKPQLIIGPRSALFAPVTNLGMIIVDEFHESTYKQTQSPRYNALRLAGYISNTHGSKLVLGSATPPVEEYFYATLKGADVYRLTEKPISVQSKVQTEIVDLSDSKQRSDIGVLSNRSLELIQERLKNKEQSIVFLNKRGTSRLILCESCGWNAVCKRCNIPYVYHHDKSQLLCHTCGEKSKPPINCPECQSPDIFFKNPGTKALEEYLTKKFPKAKIGRYDKDNKKADKFSENHAAISSGQVDILIGTQLLTKGHDLPNVSLIVICLAESSLTFPDYHASEKTFQLLHQAAGRVGRSSLDGHVLIQTFDPNADFLQYARHTKNAWINFYENELQQRKKFNFPPYTNILQISVSRKSETLAINFTQKIIKEIHDENLANIEILGPIPAFKYQQDSGYNWNLIIKSRQRSALLSIIKILPNSCTYDIDPISTL